MNQSRKDSSYESSAKIAFYSLILLLILSLFSSISAKGQYSDIPGKSDWQTQWLRQDKAEHVFACTAISMIGTATAYDFKFKNPEIAGIGLALGVGIAKEFLIDDKPDAYDLTADITGAFIGVGIVLISKEIQKKKHKKNVQRNR